MPAAHWIEAPKWKDEKNYVKYTSVGVWKSVFLHLKYFLELSLIDSLTGQGISKNLGTVRRDNIQTKEKSLTLLSFTPKKSFQNNIITYSKYVVSNG